MLMLMWISLLLWIMLSLRKYHQEVKRKSSRKKVGFLEEMLLELMKKVMQPMREKVLRLFLLHNNKSTIQEGIEFIVECVKLQYSGLELE